MLGLSRRAITSSLAGSGSNCLRTCMYVELEKREAYLQLLSTATILISTSLQIPYHIVKQQRMIEYTN